MGILWVFYRYVIGILWMKCNISRRKARVCLPPLSLPKGPRTQIIGVWGPNATIYMVVGT